MRIRHVKGAEEVLATDPLVLKNPENFKGHFHENVFLRSAPIFLEVGMGMGSFLRSMSFDHPEADFVGLEINVTVLYKALKRYRKKQEEIEAELKKPYSPSKNIINICKGAGEDAWDVKDRTRQNVVSVCGEARQNAMSVCGKIRQNVRFIRSDARFLENYFKKGEVNGIYLNFPDPWPRKKNENKRLLSPHFLKIYEGILNPQSFLEFKTDNEEFFDYSQNKLKECGWTLEVVTRDLQNDELLSSENVLTEYERKFLADGSRIYKLRALNQR